MDEDIQALDRHKMLIQRLFEEALLQGNLELLDALFSPAFVDRSSPDQLPGPAGVRAYFSALRAGFPDLQVQLEDLIAEGDRIVVRTSWQGTHLGTYEGLPASGQFAFRILIQIFRIVNDQIVEEWNAGPGLLDHLRTS